MVEYSVFRPEFTLKSLKTAFELWYDIEIWELMGLPKCLPIKFENGGRILNTILRPQAFSR